MTNDEAEKPICWGCACGVQLIDGYHREPTDVPNTVYVYPCTLGMDDDDEQE